MTQFVAFEKDIEVNGATMLSVVKGAGVFEQTARKFLANQGLSDVQDTVDAWYPQQAWLDTFKEIQATVGRQTVFLIGKKIPESAEFPPEVKTIEDGLGSIDVAYHMNHRRGGDVMFDPATGKMLEGIGHYSLESVEDRNAIMKGVNPYPCNFDRGIITAIAQRFEEGATVTHDDAAPCREKEGESCTYVVKW